MLLLIFFTIFLINLSGSENIPLTDLDLKLKNTVQTISDSFSSMFDNIKQYFQCKYDNLLERRSLTKNAFNKFLTESLNKSASRQCNYTNTRNLKVYRLIKPVTRIEQPAADTKKSVSESIITKQQMDMEMAKLISAQGYGLETHNALTADGYIITLHRIHLGAPDKRDKKKVLLHHGLLGSSKDWVLLGSNKALPYLLWLSGYDVWMTNSRGNMFSKAHTRLSSESDGFWGFSFHEIGIYDLQAAINYIKENGNSNAELHYIGYSMGATALLVLLSTHLQYNYILKSATLIAPLAYMYNVKGPMRYLADIDKYGYSDDFGSKSFVANHSIPKKIFNKYCTDHKLCHKSIFLLSNGVKPILNTDLRNLILLHASGEGSAKTIRHYAQLINNGHFQMYDYGYEKNMKKYGLRTPPAYRLNDVTLPVALITSADDHLCTVPDVASLLPFLTNLISHHVVKRPQFSHTDFLWSEDAPQLVYSIVLDVLSHPHPPKFKNGNNLRNALIMNKIIL